MAVIQVEPISARSTGGYDVTITGIGPLRGGCIVGLLYTPNAGEQRAEWNFNGIMSGGTDKANLDMSKDALAELVDLAKRLGAKPQQP
jgi:hypothetical protein